jgi:hypothetical protein
LSQANFGRDDLARRTGRYEAFLWPSPVRIGQEALSIQAKSKTTDTASGLSSAKRYLWDETSVEREWRYSGAHNGNLPLIANQTRRLLTENGDLRKKDDLAAQGLKYSRSSFMMFMIAELIAHAFAQINNPQDRKDRPNSSIPRRLSKIILTIPTATPSREQSILRRRAEDALDYVWKLLSLPEENYIYEKPALHIEWDEASCSQQVFLFNEISNVYAHKASDYIKDYGNIRKIKDQPTETLRIASIDIGGGTTDLMITSYFCERSNVIKPIQEFREGFRIAGDDILFGLIKEVILPSFSEHLKNCGGSSGDMATANFLKS